MSRVMSGDLRRVLVWFGLWARRGTHRPCICTSLEPPKRAVEQDARAPHAHRRRYTPQRDGSLRRYVGVTVTSAHTKGRSLGLKIRGANNYSMHAARMGGETGGPRDCLLVSVSNGYGGISHAPGTLAWSGGRGGGGAPATAS
jgi:hypothetical protein